MSFRSTSSLFRMCARFLLIAAGCVAYSNSLTTPIQFDDLVYLVDREQALENRPTIELSFAINRYFGDTLVGLHLWNLGVHLLAGLTLFGLVRRTLLLPRWRGRWDASATKVALAIAMLWLVHPLLTSAVTYIIQRCESMMGLCFLFCHYALLRGSQISSGWRWYAPGVIVGILGSGCKEIMAVTPVLLLLYDRTFLADSWRDVFRRRGWVHLAFASILVFPIWTALPYFRSNTIDASVGFSIQHISSWQYLLTQPSVLVHYLRLALWPDPLSFSYRDWPIADGLGASLPFALPIVLLLGVTAVGVWQARWWGFLGAWFFLILGPTSSFIPIADVCLEYRMYLSLAPVVTLVVLGVHAFLTRFLRPPLGTWMGGLLFTAATLLLVTLTYERNQVYRSSVTLWEDTVQKRPDDLLAHMNLGYSYLRVGKMDEAEAAFRRSFTLPGNPRTFLNCYNLGAILANRGDIEHGLPLIREAIQYDPNSPLPPIFLGTTDYIEGRVPDALSWLEPTLRKHPKNAILHFVLAAILLDAFPGDADKQRRAQSLLTKGKELDPDMPAKLRQSVLQDEDTKPANAFLAKKSHFDAKLANMASARPDPEILYALGRAYAYVGDTDNARATYEKALGATTPDMAALIARIRAQLR